MASMKEGDVILVALPQSNGHMIGKIGYISHDRHLRLLERLAKHIYSFQPN